MIIDELAHLDFYAAKDARLAVVARFLKEHFMEDVSFDRMEVEFIDPEKKKGLNEEYL